MKHFRMKCYRTYIHSIVSGHPIVNYFPTSAFPCHVLCLFELMGYALDSVIQMNVISIEIGSIMSLTRNFNSTASP